jgi:hypothetical protein
MIDAACVHSGEQKRFGLTAGPVGLKRTEQNQFKHF